MTIGARASERKLTAKTAEQIAATIHQSLECPIVLIGMMGAGKSKLGRALAKAIDLPFIDSDAEIEASAGCTIAEIFEKYGEPSFRSAEARVFKRLVEQGPCVIAAGGGAVMTPMIADMVFGPTLSVWVRASLDLMVERNSRDNNRPLLNGKDLRQALEDLIEVRYPVYGRADVVVESEDGPVMGVLHQALISVQDMIDRKKA